MDWTTLSGLYGDVEAYTAQLRALEARTASRSPTTPRPISCWPISIWSLGMTTRRSMQLKRVVAAAARRPGGRRMLAALTPPAESTAEPAQPEQPAGSPPAQPARAGRRPIWSAVGGPRQRRRVRTFHRRKQPVHLEGHPKGQAARHLDRHDGGRRRAILLESKDQGTMAAQVTSAGADQFQFVAAGSPPDDKGLQGPSDQVRS